MMSEWPCENDLTDVPHDDLTQSQDRWKMPRMPGEPHPLRTLQEREDRLRERERAVAAKDRGVRVFFVLCCVFAMVLMAVGSGMVERVVGH